MKAQENNQLKISVAILLLVTLADVEIVTEKLCSDYKISRRAATKLISQAKRAISEAAETDVRREIGQQKKRLDIIYETATKEGDARTALDAVRERSKLLRLYEKADLEAINDTMESEREALVRKHLESFEVEHGLPLEELARLIALRYCNGDIIERV